MAEIAKAPMTAIYALFEETKAIRRGLGEFRNEFVELRNDTREEFRKVRSEFELIGQRINQLQEGQDEILEAIEALKEQRA